MNRSLIAVSILGVLSGCGGEERFTLSVTGVNGAVIQSPLGSEYRKGTEVRLRVYPHSGYAFSHWEGDASGTDAMITVIMNGDRAITGICTVSTAVLQWPDETNTGVPSGASLSEYTGPNITTADGQVFENLIIRKRIYIDHPNVTFRNCMLSGETDAYYVIYANDAGVNLTIERCEITNGMRTTDGFTGRANYIHAPAGGFANDGYSIKASNVLLENNLIRGLRGSPGAHLDGIQIMGGENIIVRNNWIEATSSTPIEHTEETGGGVNAALFSSPHNAEITNLVVDHNMFVQDEGYYPLRIYSTQGVIVVQNNRWSITRHGLAGPYDFRECAPSVWTGNAFDDGGGIAYP